MIIGISGKIGVGKDLVGSIIQALTDKPCAFDGMSEIKEEDIIYKVWDQPKFSSKKFADTLKDFICMLLGCTREQLEDRDFKEKELGPEWNKTVWHIQSNHNRLETYLSKEEAEADLSHYEDNYNQEVYIAREDISMTQRLLLQLMGTECGRKILHPNIWVNALMSHYKPLDKGNFMLGDYSGTCKVCKCTLFGVSKYQRECKICHRREIYPNWVITDIRFPNELAAVEDREGLSIRIERGHCCGDVGFCEHGDGFNCAKPLSVHESETALEDAEFQYTINNNGTIKDLVDKVKEILIKENLI